MSNEDVTIEETEIEIMPEVPAEETEIEVSPDAEIEGEVVDEPIEEKLSKTQLALEAMQKKINRQTAANKQQQEKIVNDQKVINDLLSKINPVEPELKPNIGDFDTYVDYEAALDKYYKESAAKQAQKDILTKQQQSLAEQQSAQRSAVIKSQEDEYSKIKPSYKQSREEVRSFIESAPFNAQVIQAVGEVMSKSNAPLVIDYFGDNNGEKLEELESILKLSPIDAAIEIYKLQQKLVAPVKKENKPIPAPIQKIKGVSKGNKSLSQMSGSELVRWAKS